MSGLTLKRLRWTPVGKAGWFVVGFFAALLVVASRAVIAAPGLPRPGITVYQATPAPDNWVPTPTTPAPVRLTPAANPITAVGSLGWDGQVQCFNCAPFAATVRLTHYDPMTGPESCWDYDKDKGYCYSPTKPGIAWKGIWGIGAACPFEWPYGTWVVIPTAGAYICLDRGGSITCDPETKICAVDILGPGGAAWDGQIFEATLWVPLDPPRGD